MDIMIYRCLFQNSLLFSDNHFQLDINIHIQTRWTNHKKHVIIIFVILYDLILNYFMLLDYIKYNVFYYNWHCVSKIFELIQSQYTNIYHAHGGLCKIWVIIDRFYFVCCKNVIKWG